MNDLTKYFIKINDWLMVVLVITLALVGHLLTPVIGALAGVIIGSIIGGFWFVLSGIYHNGQRTIELLESKVIHNSQDITSESLDMQQSLTNERLEGLRQENKKKSRRTEIGMLVIAVVFYMIFLATKYL